MIKSFRHKGLEALFRTGQTKAVQAAHVRKLKAQLSMLDQAKSVEAMNLPGWRLHALKGHKPPRWSVWVNGNWRLTFEFLEGHAYVLDYEDYH
jgi:proteic killer suppression protein